jgi:hypothetical protein
MAMRVSFVRHRGRRDHVFVTRSDGSVAAWAFPSYGDDLPHDLSHLVIEEALGIARGFWGMVDAGMNVAPIDDQSTLVRDGKPLIEDPDTDFSDLKRAEQAVAFFGPVGHVWSELGFDPSEETILSIQDHLDELRREWRRLDDGGAIIIDYCGQTG